MGQYRSAGAEVRKEHESMRQSLKIGVIVGNPTVSRQESIHFVAIDLLQLP